MLYGYYPNAQTQKEDLWKLRPALKLSAKVVFVNELMPGESLSYLRAFTAPKKMRVATTGIGYSDGYAPQLGGKAIVSIRNKTFPVLAAVTSNHVMVDLNNDPDVQVGDDVTIIDPQTNSGLTADALADLGGISDYKLLIGLSAILPRTYLKA
jgi:alanine racemase